MNRVALLLVAWSAGDGLRAQVPKPTADLQGVWQEPGKPGEDPSLRWRVSVSGEKVTINVNGQELTGVVRTEAGVWRGRVTITVVITGVKGAGPATKGTYIGECWVDGDQMVLRFKAPPELKAVPPHDPEVVPAGGDDRRELVLRNDPGRLGLAPVTTVLERVKK